MENIDIQSEKPAKSLFVHSMGYGILFGGVLIVYALILYILEATMSTWASPVNYVLLILGMVLAVTSYKKNVLNGFISYGKAFTIGMLIGLFAFFILSIYHFLLYQFFDPGLIDLINASAEENILKSNPEISPEQLDVAMGWAKKFTTPPVIAVMTLITGFFMNLILALLVALFLRKEEKVVNTNI